MAFGGKNYSICENGLFDNLDDFEKMKSSESWSKLMYLFENINISISGVGAIYPIRTTPLATTSYLNSCELEELMAQEPYADIMLRFIDQHGQECKTSMTKRTFSIELEMYKKIPQKIIVASGSEKEKSVRALLNGRLLDVLVIDQLLAKRLLKPSH
jgi:deoxyribonucleoside regulator